MSGVPVSRKRVAAAGGADRLSALPDALLHSILSFLTARQAVQTSVLSRRWRDIWPSIPCLDIDYRDFTAATAAVSYHPNNLSTWSRLREFTSNLFDKHRALALERFQLHVDPSIEVFTVVSWFLRGIRYRPAAIDITMASTGFRLPSMEPGTTSRLTRLHLCRVRLDGIFAGNVRSRCPVLQDLVLVRCDCNFQEMVSSTVKSLVIEYCCWFGTVPEPRAVTVPALLSLRIAFLKNARCDEFSVNGAGCHLQASISTICDYRYVDKRLILLLCSLSNVRTLELWRFGYQPMDCENKNFPKFHNLKTLLMGQCDVGKQFSLLRLFLKNIPCLEKVTLKHCKYVDKYRKRHVQRKIATRYQKLMCFKSQDLKLIGIKYKDSNTSNLFGLLMGIRTKLEENTVVLTKELRTNELNG